MALAAWNGTHLDWARVIEEGMKKQIQKHPGALLENHEFQVYLSLLCTVALQHEASTVAPLPTSVGDSNHERPAPKRIRAASGQQSATNVQGKQQPKKKKS